jgi:iron(III) transport system substrate-binding protein
MLTVLVRRWLHAKIFARRQGDIMAVQHILRHAVIAGLAAIAAIGMSSAAFAQKTRLTVYTALENDQLEPFKKAFEADNPTIEIAWVRDSTGVVAAKLMAEKDNPRADIIWGLAASNIGLMASQGMLEPYTPAGDAALKPMFKSGKSPETWVGMDAYFSILCFNTAEAAKDKKTRPTSWADLIKPEYKDSIVMPNPASSGTGYLTVAAWLQIMGEEAGWKYMDALHQNIAQYIHSGSAPCVQAAKGERLIGIGLDTRGASEKTKGAPLDLIVPKEGLGWELEATAIVKGTKNLEAAKKLADWAASKKANELYAKTYPVVAYPGIAAMPPNYPADGEKAMIKNDVEWMAKNRDRILAEWTKRYDGKSAPKK